MPSYAAFGARLNCPFELPELRSDPHGALTAWEIEAVSRPAPTTVAEPLGTDSVNRSVQVRAFSSPEMLRLVFDDTGTFDVHRRDRRITWYRPPNVNLAAARSDLLGRVMALAAHVVGGLALHASAVAIEDRAVAFLGPKHAGKSTLAMALVRRGARFLTDDTLVLRFDGSEVRATPGVQRARLWDDTARALGAATSGSDGAKPTVDEPPADRLQRVDVPLAAAYVIGAGDAGDGVVVRREALTVLSATLACVSFSKLGALAGGGEAAVILDRAARVTRCVPLYAAAVRRDLGRLDEVADAVLGWHGRPGAP